jgi:RNA polymerase sigma-70 factor (ECF subfamily)
MTEEKFSAIVNETKGVVLSAIGTHLSGRFHHAIDDVVQETYIRAYRGLTRKSFRGDSSIESWLYAIARNEALRMNKKLHREEQKFEKSADNYDEAIEHNYESDLAIKDLENNISKLPEKYRQVMSLVALGYSTNEISEKLDIKQGTVKSRSFKGREMLMKMMKEA